MATVTVVVPHWNRRELLEPLLKRLRLQTYPIGEIVVVDNGSSDGSAEHAEALGARVIRLDRNYGFSRAVNRGVAEAATELVVIINNDVAPAEDWLERLVRALARGGNDAWFAGGRLMQAGREEYLDGSFDLLCRGGTAWRAGKGRRYGSVWEEPRRAWSVPMTAALFRTELFRRVGGLEESFESYLEDVEFGLRCAVHGYRGLYVPEAAAVHAGSATLGPWHAETTRRIARNQVWLIARHQPEFWLGRYRRQVWTAQLLWGLVALRHGAFLAWLRGKWEGIRGFRAVRDGSGGDGAALDAILEDQEQLILELQRETGFDAYWRWYFRLAGRRRG